MKKILVLKIAMFLLAFSISPAVQAQIVPLRSVGSNASYFPGSGEYRGTGNTTHMGRSIAVGTARSFPLDISGNPWVLVWENSGELVAKNGDKLLFETDRVLDPNNPDPNSPNKVFLDVTNYPICTATWVGKVHSRGGTGRFANVGPASEPLDVIAVNHPFNIEVDPEWFFDVTIRGEINLGRK